MAKALVRNALFDAQEYGDKKKTKKWERLLLLLIVDCCMVDHHPLFHYYFYHIIITRIGIHTVCLRSCSVLITIGHECLDLFASRTRVIQTNETTICTWKEEKGMIGKTEKKLLTRKLRVKVANAEVAGHSISIRAERHDFLMGPLFLWGLRLTDWLELICINNYLFNYIPPWGRRLPSLFVPGK